jgi:DNA-binding transcriptional ArsR family regulator
MPSEERQPHLEIRDPKLMRALAHPLRVALIEAIGASDTGTLTATEASELLGESPANCAFHLRTLAKYGFLEEAGGGRGRERPWRMRYRRFELMPTGRDPDTRLAAEATAAIWIDRWLARARDRLIRAYPAEWEDAAIASENYVYVTAQEAKDLNQALRRLIEPYRERQHDASLCPPGSLGYELLLFGYPVTDPPQPPDPAGPDPSGPDPSGPDPSGPIPAPDQSGTRGNQPGKGAPTCTRT